MWVVIVLLLFTMVGCQSHSPKGDEALLPSFEPVTADHTTVSDQQIHFLVSDVSVTVQRPARWEYFETDFGVVLAEHIGSVATDGQLQGLWAHIHVPPLDEMPTPAARGQNQAWYILNQIITHPDYVGGAVVSEPVGFRWDEMDAAYYLMDSGKGNVTMIVAIVAPQTQKLVACSITAPDEQADRIRTELPRLLDNLTINGVTLKGLDLNALPDPLIFPEHG